MWQSIATAVLHTAVHSAVKHARSSGQGPGGPHKRDEEPPQKKRPTVGAWVALGVMLSLCCLSSGMLSILGSVLVLVDASRPHQGDPLATIAASTMMCLAPSLLVLALAAFSVRRTRRLQKLVELAEGRDALAPEDVASALEIDLTSAKALLDASIREGYVDRAIVEATEPHGSRSELVQEVHRVRSEQRAQEPKPSARAEAPSPTPALPKVEVRADVAPGAHVRVCPFCKASVTVVETPGERPRCTACGIPFSSKV